MSNQTAKSIYLQYDIQDKKAVTPWVSLLNERGFNVVDSGGLVPDYYVLRDCDQFILVISKNIYTDENKVKSVIFDSFQKFVDISKEKLILIVMGKVKIPETFINHGIVVCRYKSAGTIVDYLYNQMLKMFLAKLEVEIEELKKSNKANNEKFTELENGIKELPKTLISSFMKANPTSPIVYEEKDRLPKQMQLSDEQIKLLVKEIQMHLSKKMEDHYKEFDARMESSDKKLKKLEQEIQDKKKKLKQIMFAISLAFPKRFSKKYSSRVFVHLYLPELRKAVEETIRAEIKKGGADEKKLALTEKLMLGQLVKVSLSSHDIDFSEKKYLKLQEYTKIEFHGTPNESCTNGKKLIMLDICDAHTDETLFSEGVEIRVYDLVLGVIPRPLATQISSAILGLGSLTMFILTLIGKIDGTFGLTSGVTALAISGFLLARLLALYQTPRQTHIIP